ncbi:MAG: phospho-N-acetylmuramoyl-pentapeptide-transferase [Rickettsiales bacterium]|nr:phospho-N-acetylmuramoyl-pentapeptide-transferase [Rickettsiales bacterium]
MNAILGSCFLSFLISFFGIKYLIFLLNKYQEFQPIRTDGPKFHLLKKAKTPTMGGIVITISILTNILLFCNLASPYVQIAICIILTFSIIGLLDDVVKVFFKNTDGFAGAKKLVLQLLVTSACVLYMVSQNTDYLNHQIHLPFFNFELNFCVLIAPIYVLIICGSSNATNITDGLDGLLSLPIVFISLTLILFSVLMMNGYHFSKITLDYGLLHDIIIVLTSTATSFACFLVCYNRNPAKIFMGDVGSLMSGALLCYIAILLKVEVLYGIMSILFVVEIVSTILQVLCYIVTHGQKKLFKMAPFHHHLEKCNWSERKIVIVMWLFSFCCCLLATILFFM